MIKRITLLLILISNLVFSQIDTNYLQIVSWNIQNFGKSKSDSTITYICNKLKSSDIIAIQKVSTSEFGAQAVAKLDDYLDRTGTSWDYIVSDQTTGPGSERYAYLYKKSRVKLKEKSLESSLENSINREPFKAVFIFKGNDYYLFNVHLVPTDKNPELEAIKLDTLNKLYSGKRIIIMGDFNLSQNSKGFNNIKRSMNPLIIGKKTSLKMKDSTDPLNMEYDNFFATKNISMVNSDVIYFYKDFKSLKEARKVSDHCPIKCTLKNN